MLSHVTNGIGVIGEIKNNIKKLFSIGINTISKKFIGNDNVLSEFEPDDIEKLGTLKIG